MKDFVQNQAVSIALVIPCAFFLVMLEVVHVVPRLSTSRLTVVRRALWVLSFVNLAVLGFYIIARFVELRVK